MSPRTGRPKSENPMNDRIYVRVTKQEKKEIMDFSSESGYSILELIRIGIEKIRSQKKIKCCTATNEHNTLKAPIRKRLINLFYQFLSENQVFFERIRYYGIRTQEY